MIYTATTPNGTRTFPSQGQRDEFIDYLGVAFADVTVGSLYGLAGAAVVNGVDITWGVTREAHDTTCRSYGCPDQRAGGERTVWNPRPDRCSDHQFHYAISPNLNTPRRHEAPATQTGQPRVPVVGALAGGHLDPYGDRGPA